MELKDFVSKLPMDKIIKTEILDNKITLPANINITKFYKDFKTNIKVDTLTDEKALFTCANIEKGNYISSTDLLNSKLRFDK